MNPFAAAARLVPALPAAPPVGPLRDHVEMLAKGGVRTWIIFHTTADAIPRWRDCLEDWTGDRAVILADLERGAGHLIQGEALLADALAYADSPAEAAKRAGQIVASQAAEVGIDGIFAPVADVNLDPENPIINCRAYGDNPDAVAERVAAFISGAQPTVAAVAKHFPGHGRTRTDSHESLPVLDTASEAWWNSEVKPFQAAMQANVWGVMTGHLVVPSLDSSGEPATTSHAITTSLLREQLGFEGVIVTDALNMEGIGQRYGGAGAALAALRAGADLALMPADPVAALKALLQAESDGELDSTASLARLANRPHALASLVVSDSELSAHSREVAGASLRLKGNWAPWNPTGQIIVWLDKIDHHRYLPLLDALPHEQSIVFVGASRRDAVLQQLEKADGPTLLAIFSRAAAWVNPISAQQSWPSFQGGVAVFGNVLPWQNHDATPVALMPTDVPEAQRVLAERLQAQAEAS